MAFVRNGQTAQPTTPRTAPRASSQLEKHGSAALSTVESKPVAYTANGKEITLSLDDITRYFCPDADEADGIMFLSTCSRNGFDPFLREAYLIKYDKSKPASIVVGKDAYMKRAEEHPDFDGFEAGILVLIEETGEIDEREGSAFFPALGEQLLGGWAKVYRKSRSRPYFEQVSLPEYDKKQSKWKDSPATMIRKVALVHALREAFPTSFGGTYIEEEVDFEGTAREVGDAPASRSSRRLPSARAVEISEPEAQAADPKEAAALEDDPFGGEGA